jgi:hypothetical protein
LNSSCTISEKLHRLNATRIDVEDELSCFVEVLSKSKKPPAGYEQARTGLDGLKALWGEATAAASAGNYEEAVTKARSAQAQGKEIMGQLGMSS